MPQTARTLVWIAVLLLAVPCAPAILNGQSGREADPAVWEPRPPQDGHPGSVVPAGLLAAPDASPATAPRHSVARDPPDQTDLIPLAPPGRAPERGKDGTKPASRLDFSTIITVGSSLAVVLGLFLVVAWIMRRTTPGTCPALTGEVFEVLGRAPLAARQQVHLVRLGAKLVLLSVSPAGVEALSEVTDPDEVIRLAGLCQRVRPDSATAAFRQVFQRFSKNHPADRPIEPARGGHFQGSKGASRGTGGGFEANDV